MYEINGMFCCCFYINEKPIKENKWLNNIWNSKYICFSSTFRIVSRDTRCIDYIVQPCYHTAWRFRLADFLANWIRRQSVPSAYRHFEYFLVHVSNISWAQYVAIKRNESASNHLSLEANRFLCFQSNDHQTFL